jgi:hypothetical protein
MIVHVEAVYFQCARAIIRSKLWETAKERRDLPSPGEILAHLSQQRAGGEEYNKNWQQRSGREIKAGRRNRLDAHLGVTGCRRLDTSKVFPPTSQRRRQAEGSTLN